MRTVGYFDCALITKEMTEFFHEAGYTHVLVYACKPCGTVDIIILGGRLRPPKREQIMKFNELKIQGVCYSVSRSKFLFGKPFELWNNKRWDVD